MGLRKRETKSFHSIAICQEESMAGCCGEAPPTPPHSCALHCWRPSSFLFLLVLFFSSSSSSSSSLSLTSSFPSSSLPLVLFHHPPNLPLLLSLSLSISCSSCVSHSLYVGLYHIFYLAIRVPRCVIVSGFLSPTLSHSVPFPCRAPNKSADGWVRPVYPECNCAGWWLFCVSIVVPIYCHRMSIPRQLCNFRRFENLVSTT